MVPNRTGEAAVVAQLRGQASDVIDHGLRPGTFAVEWLASEMAQGGCVSKAAGLSATATTIP